jgi:hypothetical protein
MIYIIQFDTLQYKLEGPDIDLAQAWEKITQDVEYLLDSGFFPYRKLVKTGFLYVFEGGDLTGFKKRYDSFRNYHILISTFATYLETDYGFKPVEIHPI